MTPEEAWLRLAQECPRRIIPALHRSGEYLHGTTPRFPGKVLCCHRHAGLPAGWVPTIAQQQASSGSQVAEPPTRDAAPEAASSSRQGAVSEAT
jgi:hypothetical protein